MIDICEMQSKWFDGLMVLIPVCVYNEYLGCNLNLSESMSTFEVTRCKSVSFDYEIRVLIFRKNIPADCSQEPLMSCIL